MSWPQWPASNVPPVPTQPVINSAPAVVPPGLQYTADQWAQLQQQNWNQWAQWQQQYQQWHQQYGAEYQKSMNALAQTQVPTLPNIAVPPPLPNTVENKPPLPAEDPPPNVSYSTLPPQPAPPVPSYTTAPPPVSKPNYNNNNRNNAKNSKWNNNPNQNQQRYNSNDFYQNKRPFEHQNNDESNKRPPMPKWQSQPPPPIQPVQKPPPPKENIDELSEAEKKFDKQFAEWEAQFNKWKEQNSEHPDKEQYREYEKRWESWRAQLLERREQMKRKRLGLATTPTDSPNRNRVFSGQQPNFSQGSPQNKIPSLLGTPNAIFNKPPPNLNDEPLKFKQNASFPDMSHDNSDLGEIGGMDFLKPMSGGGIPGLDLVKDDPKSDQPIEEVVILDAETEKNQGPDFDAISKGINNILGDEKLLNMLSMVSQNQNLKITDNVVNTTSRIQENNSQETFSQYQEQSNQSYEEQSNQSESYNQRENVNNFDDQTRSSFTMAQNDFEQQQQSSNQFGRNQKNHFSNRFDSFDQQKQFKQPNKNDTNRSSSFSDQFGGSGMDRRFGDGFRQGNDHHQYENDRQQQQQHFNQDENERFGNNKRRSFNNQSDNNFGGRRQDNYNRNFHNNNRQYDEYNMDNDNYDNYEEYNEGYDNENWGDDYNQEGGGEEGPNPAEEEEGGILTPATVIDYEHKPIKPPEPEVLIEPIYMFDYRHKPINRIPLPQRPKWLSETVKFIHEFDPPVVRPYEIPGTRRYPGPPPPSAPNWRNNPPDRYARRPEFEPRRSYSDVKTTNRDWTFERRREEKKPMMESTVKPIYEESKSSRDSKSMELDGDDNISEPDWEDYNNTECKNDFVSFEKTTDNSNKSNFNKNVVLIEDIINPPGRHVRPPRIVIILRGPPGSGKTFLAKLIKDREVENGGSTPRILSLDDYFMVEQEKEVNEDGKNVTIKEMVYEYEAEMEDSYRLSLIKSFKKTVTDGYFSFIIVDNVNDKVKYFGEMWSFAKQNGFQVYVCQLDLDVQTCSKRNIHGRTEAEIEKCVAAWEPTPAHHPTLDATSLLQSASIPEVEMEEVNSPESDMCENDGSEDQVARSKWDNFDCSVDNLAKLDGLSKPFRHSRTMEEYLQLDTEWAPSKPTKPGQKRVRWADLEEQKQQEKMRAIGFVVGHTNWDRMMDPTNGGSALTQTKYIERTGRYKVDQM